MKSTAHILSQIDGEVAGVGVEYENSDMVDAREMIYVFKENSNELPLEELCQMTLNSAMCLYVMHRDETAGCNFLTRPFRGHFVLFTTSVYWTK